MLVKWSGDTETYMPGINEPGADRMLTRMHSDAKNMRSYWLTEAENALGESCQSFAKEMAGNLLDIISEINVRIEMLITNYQDRINEINTYYTEADIEDINDLRNVESRLQGKLNHLKRTLGHA